MVLKIPRSDANEGGEYEVTVTSELTQTVVQSYSKRRGDASRKPMPKVAVAVKVEGAALCKPRPPESD